MVFKKTKP